MTSESPVQIAFITVHGMGQPVPYDTIDGVSQIVESINPEGKTQPVTQLIKIGDKNFARAEHQLLLGDQTFNVHVYEVYWAPETEGKINAWQVVSFMFDAGWRGIFAGFWSNFQRWIFGGWESYGLTIRTISALILLFLTFASIVILDLVIGAISVLCLLPPSIVPQYLFGMSNAVLGDLLIAVIPALVTIILYGIPKFAEKNSKAGSKAGWLEKTFTPLTWLLLIATMLALWASAIQAFGHVLEVKRLLFLDWISSPLGTFILQHATAHTRLIVLFLAAAFCWLTHEANKIFVQYMGDVAIYVSSYTVNEFQKTRERIKALAAAVFEAVYGARENGDFIYSKVFVLGHSLGSVISYDALNALILEDNLNQEQPKYSAVERTRLFVTFGSPLDKTAFLFRSQVDRKHETREALAQATQPMIERYTNRPECWVNIYSPNDIISGALDFYDRQDSTDPKRVNNITDPDATVPLLAHNQYWCNEKLMHTLKYHLEKFADSTCNCRIDLQK